MSPKIGLTLISIILVIVLIILYIVWIIFKNQEDLKKDLNETCTEIKRLSVLDTDCEQPIPCITPKQACKKKKKSLF